MSIRFYHDFVIFTDYIDDDDTEMSVRLNKFSLRVFDSPIGEGEHHEEVIVQDWDQLEQWRAELAERKITHDNFVKFAQRLGELILPPYARQLYQISRNLLQEGDGLRIRLRLLRELAFLPWEYALIKFHDNEITPEDYWALDFKISIVRHEAIAVPAEPFRSGSSRRVILAMASPLPYHKFAKLDLRGEQRAIKSELRNVRGIQAEFHPDFDGEIQIDSATVDIIRKALQKPADIFHFSGHGVFNSDEGCGAIILADKENQAEEIDAGILSGLLAEGHIRLVVLDACESGKRDRFLQWSSLALALLKQGVPAVIAMQYSVFDDSMKEFAKKLYEYLVGGLNIDEAVVQGRKSIHRLDSKSRDWGVPILYMRNSGGKIFPPVSDKQARIQAEMISERDITLSEVLMSWARKGVIANPDQIEILKASGNSLHFTPIDTLLLLRSALSYDQDTGYWVEQLRNVGSEWLTQIQNGSIVGEEEELGQAEKLLGLDAHALGQPTNGVGTLTWSAVKHPNLLTGQTASLALLALEPQNTTSRIQSALRSIDDINLRRKRRAVLLGSLAEADPGIDANLPQELDNLQDRFAVWWWRARKHLRRAKQKISHWTIGGALGAALALAIYRATLAVFNARPIGTEFAVNSYWGFIVGLGLVFGKVIAGPLLLQDPDDIKPDQHRRVTLLSTLLGALGFSLANGIVAWMNGSGLHPVIFLRFLVATFFAGVSLSLGLYNQPVAGWKLSKVGWLSRLSVVGLLLAIIQLPVLCEAIIKEYGIYWLRNAEWLAASIIEPSQAFVDKYRLYPFLDEIFMQCVPGEIGKCCFACPSTSGDPFSGGLFYNCFEQWLSVIDAALIGMLLILGITAGIHFTETKLGKVWAKLKFKLGFL